MASRLDMAGPTVSVVLCTCNGEAYLSAQLSSLMDQVYPPSEVVVFDDASEDGTAILLQDFEDQAAFAVHVFRNPSRVGVVPNFEQAIQAGAGEVIALCDQDDIWLPNKLQALVAALQGEPNALAVFSNALVVDAELNPLGYTMWQQIGFTSGRQRLMLKDRPWEVLFKDPVATGATMMFRRELLPFILPIPDGWIHDAWIAQIAASQGRLVSINEPLVLYRQHSGNVIGGKRLSLAEQLRRADVLGRLGLVRRELRRYRALHARLDSFPATPRRDAMLALADAKLRHLVCREQLPSSQLRRWPTVLRELLNGNYARFAKDWRNVAADLFMS